MRLVSFAGANIQLEPNWQAYVSGVERFLTTGHYFSDLLDISQSLQAQAKSVRSGPDSRYIWNSIILKDFVF